MAKIRIKALTTKSQSVVRSKFHLRSLRSMLQVLFFMYSCSLLGLTWECTSEVPSFEAEVLFSHVYFFHINFNLVFFDLAVLPCVDGFCQLAFLLLACRKIILFCSTRWKNVVRKAGDPCCPVMGHIAKNFAKKSCEYSPLIVHCVGWLWKQQLNENKKSQIIFRLRMKVPNVN